LFEAQIHVLGADITWREIIGNLFGLASAILGMRRNVWTWPVGIVGNILLFTVFLGAVFDTPQDKNLYGQAARQVFFFTVAIYGWWRWTRARNQHEASDGGAIAPRWASSRERLGLVAAAAVGVAVCYPVLSWVGSYGALADGWIFVGSLLATYGMARGWVEFWLIWIGVDIVGVPLLVKAGYYPSALLYAVYGGFCVWGFAVWLRAERRNRDESLTAVEASA
jgi:nicotinamide mononucleotide transporter